MASFAGSTDYVAELSSPTTFTITAAPLTITAVNQTKAYGAALPTFTASYAGFVGGDTAASLTTQPTLSTTATAASHVASSPYAITASGAVDPNYTISYVAGSLTMTPVALSIAANNQFKAYGAALPSLTASYSGFVNGDTSTNLATQPTLSTTATAASHVASNPYTIIASGAVDSDYTISYVAGSLDVTPVALTVTANNQTKAYGAALPSLTASYSGFVNGGTSTNLATQPTLSTTATAASHVAGNPYTITASGAVDSDYTISYVAGSLNVTPVALTVTANNQSKAYGAALPSLTASYSGFVNGDTSTNLATQPTLSTTATAASHVAGSPYAITTSGAVDSDYTISYVSGSLTVTPVALTIIANNQSKAYGAALPTLTASYSGFVNGDTSTNLTTQPTLSTTATTMSPVAGNPYSITISGAVDTDYTISYSAGSLTITVAPTTISVPAAAIAATYGQSVTLSATVSGSPTPNEGTVTFAIGGSTVGTASVSAGVAQLVTTTLPTGTDEITVTYGDSSGNYASSITAVGATSTISTAAGAGNYSGNGGQATQATLNGPRAIAVDAAGDVFIADSVNNVVREVNHATGVITTVAGNGTQGYNGDNIVATAAELFDPDGLALDSAGDLFIVDEYNDRIREVNAVTGVITTVAGTGVFGFGGDNSQATAAKLADPAAIAIDSTGDLFIADMDNYRIREVNKATGVITTIAGNGTLGFSGDGGLATAAELNTPQGIAVDSSGDVFIADTNNYVIREVNAATGTIKTIAGIGGSVGFSGDGGLATAAKLFYPHGLAVDSSGDVFIADYNNNRIREVNGATGVIATVAGNGTLGFSGDGRRPPPPACPLRSALCWTPPTTCSLQTTGTIRSAKSTTLPKRSRRSREPATRTAMEDRPLRRSSIPPSKWRPTPPATYSSRMQTIT